MSTDSLCITFLRWYSFAASFFLFPPQSKHTGGFCAVIIILCVIRPHLEQNTSWSCPARENLLSNIILDNYFGDAKILERVRPAWLVCSFCGCGHLLGLPPSSLWLPFFMDGGFFFISALKTIKSTIPANLVSFTFPEMRELVTSA